MTLTEAQDMVAHYAPQTYYADAYRGYEASYLPHVCETLSDYTPGVVLDVGPGWGTMAVWLAGNGWQVQVTDFLPLGTFIGPDLLGAGGFRYLQRDVETAKEPLPIQADLILMTMVFGHLRYRPDNAIHRACKMLAPGGTFLCCNLDRARHAHVDCAYTEWEDMPVPGDGQPLVDDMVTSMMDVSDYRSLLRGCFRSVKLEVSRCQPVLHAVCREPRP